LYRHIIFFVIGQAVSMFFAHTLFAMLLNTTQKL
jgi:hypothetical protein